MRPRQQVPGQLYVFKDRKTGEEDSVVLPGQFGESSNFAYWNKSNNTWISAKFNIRRARDKRRLLGVAEAKKQIPGQPFTFINRKTKEVCTVVLPEAKGESNKDVIWGKTNKSWRCRLFTRQYGNEKRRQRGCRTYCNQKPGIAWSFYDKVLDLEHEVVLPPVYGESNDEVFWKSYPKSNKNGGFWKSRKIHLLRFKDRYTGKSKEGLLGRFRVLFTASKSRDPRQGYAAFKSTPEQMLIEWENQQGLCAACKLPLKILKAHYDHDHTTGEGRGFVHAQCNLAEGAISKMSNEAFENFVSWERRKRNIS
jgi:hypothetical protein